MLHVRFDAENGCGAARVAHAPRAERDAEFGGRVFDEGVGDHFACGLEGDRSVGIYRGGIRRRLADKNIKEMVEPVSAWSPTDFRRLEGIRERMRTTGVSVVSCRSRESDEMR